MDRREVLVLGAGVIGLTTAVTLAEAGYRVTVRADEIPGRTSLSAGASWGPYLVEPVEKVATWSLHTLTVLTELADVPGSGVRRVAGVEASREGGDLPSWTRHLPEIRECRPDELPRGFVSGWHYAVPVVDMPRHLAYLLSRLRDAGGRIEPGRATDLERVSAIVPVVVNCTGLGARLLAADESLRPVRGQLVVVANPGIRTFFSEDTGPSPYLTHWLPQGDTVVLGGTAIPDAWDREPDPDTAAAIIARCAEIEPRLSAARVLAHRVGLRPTRPEVRLEAQPTAAGVLIHNYGHGGAGVSLSWGCAEEIRQVLAPTRRPV